MNTTTTPDADAFLKNIDRIIPELESSYKDVHSHPELSMQEFRTAGLAADQLRAAGYEVTTQVGQTGVVGLLRNGDGPIVMLRADTDALPVEETIGLPLPTIHAMRSAARSTGAPFVPMATRIKESAKHGEAARKNRVALAVRANSDSGMKESKLAIENTTSIISTATT